MRYAIVTSGAVTNVIALREFNAGDFPGAVALHDRPVGIGDTYSESKFWRDGEELLTSDEKIAAMQTAAVAVLRDDVLLYEAQCNNGLTHSETLLPMIDTALKAAGLTVDDLDVLGVTNGPGSFTGLRIGLAVVKGLALPRQIPCAGVSTMAALAYGLAGEGTVIGAQDARRGQVYWGAFDLAAHDRLTPDSAAPVTTLENFVQTCKKPLFFVGDGATLCYNTYKNVPGVVCVPQPMQVLRGAGVALAARAMWERGECVPPAALLPDYHRLSQAERERAEREKTEGKQNEV